MISDREQQVYFGAQGSQNFLETILKNNNISRVFLVCGTNSCQSSGADLWLSAPLSGLEVARFSDFSENTDVTDLKKALAVYQKSSFDAIIAIGGGTALDLAKLTGFFAAADIDTYLNNQTLDKSKKKFTIAIPTTAGTGSEATHFAVLYRDKVKYSVANRAILPDVAIINPDLTDSMPPYLTASTGMDALAQAIESYWSEAATDESKKYAEEAIILSVKYLEKAVNSPDKESRESMAKAAYLAGKAINISKTTICHALSYTMTSYYNYPHGHAVSLFLAEISEQHIKRGVLDTDFFHLFPHSDPVRFVKKLINAIGLGVRNNLNRDEVKKIVSQINPERLKNNPVQFNADELEKIAAISLNNDSRNF